MLNLPTFPNPCVKPETCCGVCHTGRNRAGAPRDGGGERELGARLSAGATGGGRRTRAGGAAGVLWDVGTRHCGQIVILATLNHRQVSARRERVEAAREQTGAVRPAPRVLVSS